MGGRRIGQKKNRLHKVGLVSGPSVLFLLFVHDSGMFACDMIHERYVKTKFDGLLRES